MTQIGTVKLQTQNSGVVDVPVFETGDSASGVFEFVRVETASGTGFIPVTDPADATYPYLRVQSQNNGIVAVTDTAGDDIPDSVVARYDASEEESTGAITTINDLRGDADLSGDAEVVSDQINGLQAFKIDRGELMRTSTNIADTDPQTILAVIEPRDSTPSEVELFLDADDVNKFAARIEDGGSNYGVRRGDGSTISGGSPSETPQLFELEGRNDDEINLRVDSNEVISGTDNEGDLDGFTLGGRGDSSTVNSAPIYAGEVVILEDHSVEDQESERNRLADKWGISL